MGRTQATPTAGNRRGPDENTARRTTGGLCDIVLQPSRPGAADLPTLGLATGRPCIPTRHPTDGRASPPALAHFEPSRTPRLTMTALDTTRRGPVIAAKSSTDPATKQARS